MKRHILLSLLVLMMLTAFHTISFADDGGEMGIFGGISEGTNLPKTMEKHVDSKIKKQTKFAYREVVFLSGVPIECKGTITVIKGDVDFIKKPSGTYTEKYTVEATDASGTTSINRTLNLTTSYRVVEGDFTRQILRDSQVTKWDETIVVGGVSYKLDTASSTFSKSSVEDVTPGVSYYNTVVSNNAHYIVDNVDEVIVMVDGNINGFSQPWSKVESQKLKMVIFKNGEINTVVELKPFMEAKKTMFYNQSNPYPISFEGTFNQRLERESTLSYNVLASAQSLTSKEKKGSLLLAPANEFEKLPIPENLDFLAGHWAAEDIKKMYSMEIFTDLANEGMQFQAMQRGAFVKALCLAMDISTEKYEKITRTSPQIFGDVPTNHPLYKYIMAAYDAKLIKGNGENFNVDAPISRQEAFTIYVRVIGLERLGVTNSPQTPFVDDNMIASWAKKEIMAGFKLGIIKGDSDGKVLPNKWMSKADAAAIINRLIDYLREEIAVSYRQ